MWLSGAALGVVGLPELPVHLEAVASDDLGRSLDGAVVLERDLEDVFEELAVEVLGAELAVVAGVEDEDVYGDVDDSKHVRIGTICSWLRGGASASFDGL
ncbi:hypothetical protein ACFU5Y_33185 [Streptomyces gardneri]|uniref:hypothetical protein n=1 Tax=Streptomyces gardneri TaxID=66892 RepID=UPI0036BF6183